MIFFEVIVKNVDEKSVVWSKDDKPLAPADGFKTSTGKAADGNTSIKCEILVSKLSPNVFTHICFGL
jgi:hypothetical protein